MKRMKLILPILLLLIVGCDEDATSPEEVCLELTTAFNDAYAEFESNMTLTNCEAQIDALGAWCDGDCEPSDTAAEDSLCTDMADLDAASITAMCELLIDNENDSDDEDLSEEYSDFITDLFEEVPCIEDCGISSPTSMCTFLGDDTESTCMDDCTEDDEPDLELLAICTACLEGDNCDAIFIDDEDDSDDEFPECFLDCDMTIFSSSTATCEFFGGDDISCTDDCTGDDAAMITIYTIQCGTCVEDGDCDDLFDDEDGEDEDGDDAPPECASDCDGYDSMIGEDETDDYDVWCGWLSTWSTDGCLSDCTADELEEADILEVVEVCTECLANENCQYVIDGSDDCDVCHDDCDDDDDACHDDCDENYCDDGPPECFDDCDYAPTDESTGTEICEFIGGDISCTDDCYGEDAIGEEIIAICAACLEAGNCDELFTDDGDDDGDASDDGPPECFLDCPGVETWFESSATDTCTDLVDGYNQDCMEDCDVDGDDPYGMLDAINLCQGCLEAGNCDELFTDDECDECHDDCDDDDDTCHDDCDENNCDDDDGDDDDGE